MKFIEKHALQKMNTLEKADVTGVSTNKENIINVEMCKEFIPVKYFHDHSIDEVCYRYMPILSEKGNLLFVDDNNYVHHYSPSRRCTEVVDGTKTKNYLYTTKKIIMKIS
uniref:Methyltransferase n=1 Tax=Strongyloides papillosus TaxID=174720 RepID=A0A0N5BFS3_STREA